jgi:D-beta-D-heptose 7-phosphate kinase/D-beta-D-heptose 1-phosphate adenosyltransferase
MAKIVVVSGGFDPVHVGHVRMLEEAKALGDRLIVLANSDHWLRKKKGFVFMPEQERKEILESMRWVDEVIITSHGENPHDMSVAADLERLRPDVFANGGDRKPEQTDIPTPEYEVAARLGIELVFNIGRGGKVQSSSELVKRAGVQAEK